MASLLVLGGLEIVLDTIAIFASLVVLIFGFYGVREEARWAVMIFVIACLVLPTYVIFKLFYIRNDPNFTPLLMAGITSILVRSAMFWSLWRTYQKFGLGLRDQIFVNRGSPSESSVDEWLNNGDDSKVIRESRENDSQDYLETGFGPYTPVAVM